MACPPRDNIDATAPRNPRSSHDRIEKIPHLLFLLQASHTPILAKSWLSSGIIVSDHATSSGVSPATTWLTADSPRVSDENRESAHNLGALRPAVILRKIGLHHHHPRPRRKVVFCPIRNSPYPSAQPIIRTIRTPGTTSRQHNGAGSKAQPTH